MAALAGAAGSTRRTAGVFAFDRPKVMGPDTDGAAGAGLNGGTAGVIMRVGSGGGINGRGRRADGAGRGAGRGAGSGAGSGTDAGGWRSAKGGSWPGVCVKEND